MSLTTTTEPRSHKRALFSTTALTCFILATTPVSAFQGNDAQDAKVVHTSVKDDNPEETTASGTATATTTAAAMQADTNTYPASFFDQYTPQTALDMIRRLPGFSFDEGSSARGFGGTAGNVLIDGSRPTSKSGGLRGALDRIPAAQVERIEIYRGGVSGGEAAGQSTVANVIRKQTGTSGTWEFKVRTAPDGSIAPNFEGALATRLGGWDTSFDWDVGGWVGYRTALIEDRDAAGSLTSTSDEILDEENEWLWLSGEGSRDFAGGKLTLNGRIGGNNWNGDTRRDNYEARQPSGDFEDYWVLGERNENRESELGIDWTRTYANAWKWRLIGLGVLKKRDYSFDYFEEDLTTGEDSESTFNQVRDQSELILRTTYGLTSGKFKPEFGIEGARNQMDSDIEETEDGVFLADEAESVTVREYRAEAFATFNYQIFEKLTLDGGMTYEASEIKVSGHAQNTQTNKFWKPRLSATYSFNDNLQLTLEGEKEVGQLNFNLFAASTEAADGRDQGGNAELRPDYRWRTAATLDWTFSERGSLQLKAYHHWRKDIIEEILLPSGEVGDGNAGDARFYGFAVEANIPTDFILKNGLLEIEYNHRNSRFDDPILGGATRPISWYTPDALEIEFRQDLTDIKFSWGVEFRRHFKDTGYQVDQISTFEGNDRFEAFIETTRFWGLRMRINVNHLNTGEYTRSRFFYEDNRAGVFEGTEVAFRKRKPEFRFVIAGTF